MEAWLGAREVGAEGTCLRGLANGASSLGAPGRDIRLVGEVTTEKFTEERPWLALCRN